MLVIIVMYMKNRNVKNGFIRFFRCKIRTKKGNTCLIMSPLHLKFSHEKFI